MQQHATPVLLALTAHGAPEELARGANVCKQKLHASHAKAHPIHNLYDALTDLSAGGAGGREGGKKEEVQKQWGNGDGSGAAGSVPIQGQGGGRQLADALHST